MRREQSDGFSDNLTPLVPLDPKKIETVNDLVTAMSQTAFGARTIGEAAAVLEKMILDPDSFNVLTVTGAMTPAKMGPLIQFMIEQNWIQAVVTTGALMSHGLVEGVGLAHFQTPKGVSDQELFKRGYNRIYDVLEPEKNLDTIEAIIFKALETIEPGRSLSSRLLWQRVGEYLSLNTPGEAILKSAYLQDVPIFTPAMTDAEASGIDVYLHRLIRQHQNLPIIPLDIMIDMDYFTRLMARQKKWGIFTIGGGVPRNWAQQVGPAIDLISQRHNLTIPGETPWWQNSPTSYEYAVRICPDPPHFGHLSGCTYSEGVSWGKINPRSLYKETKTAEVLADATIAWPLILVATLQRLKGKKINKKIPTGKDVLQEIEQLTEKQY